MFASLLETMASECSDYPITHIPRRRKMSSDSTISAHSVDQYSNAFSSTPPTSIGESISDSNCLMYDSILYNSAQNLSCSRIQNFNNINTFIKVPHRTEDCSIEGFSIRPTPPQEPRRSYKRKSETLIHRDTSSFPTDMIRLELDQRRSVRIKDKEVNQPLPSGSLNSKHRKSIVNTLKNTSSKRITGNRRSTRSSGERIGNILDKLSMLGKRRRSKPKDRLSSSIKCKRELRNLADTNEFAKIDTSPVVHEVWSKGKLLKEPPKKKNKLRETNILSTPKLNSDESIVPHRANIKPREKKLWLNKGLYAGQQSYHDQPDEQISYKKMTKTRSISLYKTLNILPLPMWYGERLLKIGRDFKLPFDICSPLPPGQPKPDEWRKTTKNRFVGEAGAQWKVSKFIDSSSSKCVCKPETGCDEDCQNRIMFYECDDTNCASGSDRCTNRAFAGLQERLKAGGKYRVGVEVIKTADRGYGVRSNRCFEPHQIIVEYTGEIITEEECDRRMLEDYKDNDCYYLMLFDQSMIIDATKGSIARFINHSCKPNCRMVKWIVGGNPRMALFAGDKPIMTGDELTYDYNFDPFSTKNIQKCLCGSENCRGVLGPKPRDFRSSRENVKDIEKTLHAGPKRKIKDVKGSDDIADNRQTKRRKPDDATEGKRSCSSAGMKFAQNAFQTIKKNISTKLIGTDSSTISKQLKLKTKQRNFLLSKTLNNQKLKALPRKSSALSLNLSIKSTYSPLLRSKEEDPRLFKRKAKQSLVKSIRSNSYRKSL